MRRILQQSPSKSVRRASLQLQLPRETVRKVLRKRLHLYAYKVQIVQELKPNDKPRRKDFAELMLARINMDDTYLDKVCFSDEATFYISGKVNRHNVQIWGSENSHEVREHIRDSPKVNVWCGLLCNKVIGPFFFCENTVNSQVYLDLLERFVFPQLQEFQPNILFQQDGAPPHWSLEVRQRLNNKFPDRWIGRDGPTEWPPQSPDITPLDFFFLGLCKRQSLCKENP